MANEHLSMSRAEMLAAIVNAADAEAGVSHLAMSEAALWGRFSNIATSGNDPEPHLSRGIPEMMAGIANGYGGSVSHLTSSPSALAAAIANALGVDPAVSALSSTVGEIFDKIIESGVEPPAGVAPVISSVVIYGNAGGTLTCVVTFSTSGTPTPTVTYEWRGDTVALPGEDASTCDTSAYPGEVITCYVEATNATGTDDGLSNELGPVPTGATAREVEGFGTPQASADGITVPWPTHVAGQRAFLHLETANETVASPGGDWVHVAGSPFGAGTAGAGGGTGMTLFTKITTGATGGTPEASVSIADVGDHVMGVIFVVSGDAEADDITDTTTSTASSASNPYSMAVVDVADEQSLVLEAISHRFDTATAQFSNWTQPSGATVSEHYDEGTALGNGGGVALASWVAENTGTTSATTYDAANVNVTMARMTLVLKPVDVGDYGPVNTGAPSITETPMVGQTINLNTGTWDLGEPEGTLSSQLYADDVAVVGGTGSTFELTEAEEGAMLRLDVLVNNGIGNILVSSPEVGPVVPFEEGGTGIGAMSIGSTFVVA
jgi:hypothetical protein